AQMATTAAAEPGLKPLVPPALEPPVPPASMFAPEPECGSEVRRAGSAQGGESLSGESADQPGLCSKLALVSPTGEQYDCLLKDVQARTDEGSRETIYVVGVGSDGGNYGLDEKDMAASVATVQSLCEQIDADLVLLRERRESGGQVRDYLIRRRVPENDFMEQLSKHAHHEVAGSIPGVGSNAGIIGMTKEHLGLALALSVPVFVVVTKIDMCPANILQETLKLLQRLLKSPGCRKIPVLVQNKDDVIITASNFSSERVCPIFQISNVTGENMDLLKMFLNLLSSRSSFKDDEPAEFQIDETYSVPGVGTVVSGTTLRGWIHMNDTLLLGPDPLGVFLPITVKSIHRKRMPVKEVRGGQTASFALKKIKRSAIRKGMVMVSPQLNPQASWEFEAEILVLHHPTTISPRYQAMVHCGSIRQTASILSMNKECLRTGDKATVRFRFIKTPEFLHTEQRLVFREGRTKAVGTITKVRGEGYTLWPSPI
uniref:GTP-binding protein 1 n=1 Tax=Astyanax mexicanus TaxID=7994 RepID=A0A8B9LA45_ASTMX